MLSTKNVTTGGTGASQKTITPGNQIVKVLSVKLEESRFKPGSYHLVLNVEGEDMGEGFEGFFIDKDNPELGRHKGQVGKIKTSDWAYMDGQTKSGVQISRDLEILKAVKNICMEMGVMDWYDAQDEKHETIEEFVQAFNEDAPFREKWVKICVAGREYLNKQGYTNYDLHLPKYSKGHTPMVLKGRDDSKLIQFDPSTHVKKADVKPVDSFGDEDQPTAEPRPKKISSDFEL